MDDTQIKQVEQVLMAARALAKSAEKTFHSGMIKGTGDLAVRSYQQLHARLAALLPDDDFVTEGLRLDAAASGADVGDEEKYGQVMLLLGQMTDYVDGLLKPARTVTYAIGTELPDLKGLGRELQDQIINLTRQTLRRAISGLDIGVPPEPPVPPVPPVAPTPPGRGARIHVEIHADDDEKPKNDDPDAKPKNDDPGLV